MTTIKILIVEDDPLFVIDLKRLIKDLDYQLIGAVDNAEDVFKTIKKEKPDLVLMDIDIKGERNGIEIAKELKDEPIAIIFITNYSDKKTFQQARAVLPCGYLVKPFNQFTLESIIEYAVSTLGFDGQKEQEDYSGWEEDIILKDFVFIKRNNHLEKVAITEIDFVQSEGNYSIISLGKKKYALKLSLVKVYEFFKKHPFLRVNKRHLINMDKVNSIDLSNNKILVGDAQFSIGRTYKDIVLKRINKLS